MNFTYYQDDYCYYFRKPAGIPSTFGKEKSFLDCLLDCTPWEGDRADQQQVAFEDRGVSAIAQSLFAFFGTEGELWLLNRLDNETSWLLYFAKNPRVYHQFKFLQSSSQLNKYYLAEVYGDISPLMKGGKGGSSAKHYIDYNHNLKELARDLRNNQTQAEKNLRYYFLSTCGHKFQRQKPIDGYIVDFFCKEFNLVIELDGDSHFTEKAIVYDAKRTEILEQLGFEVLRFTNEEVFHNFGEVCTRISEYRTSPTPPSKGGKYKITYPLAHHKFSPDRMVVIKQESDLQKAKWTGSHLITEILEFQFLPTTNTSILLIKIQKGFRHQIRAHLSAIGYPICWDKLYSKSDHKGYSNLQLFSVGIETV